MELQPGRLRPPAHRARGNRDGGARLLNLTRKIGPLPAWAWAVGAGLAIALGLYLRKRASAASASSPAGGGTTLGDLANSVAGGATAQPPSGLDPATADLLANAENALVASTQAYSDAITASAGSALATDPFGGGFGAPASTNVGSSSGSGAATTAATPTTTSPAPAPSDNWKVMTFGGDPNPTVAIPAGTSPSVVTGGPVGVYVRSGGAVAV